MKEFKQTAYCKALLASLEQRKFKRFEDGVNDGFNLEQVRERIEEIDDIIQELSNA